MSNHASRAVLKFTDWAIDDAGMIMHLNCDHPWTWAHSHRCWIPIPQHDPYSEGYYIEIKVPETIAIIAKIKYEVWNASREKGFK